jgi:hypothetical protein
MDVVGNDIACNPLGTNTPGDLASRCQATAGCVAFNIHQQPGGVPNYCLKSARSPVSDQKATWMKGSCQGIYTGAQRVRCCGPCLQTASCVNGPPVAPQCTHSTRRPSRRAVQLRHAPPLTHSMRAPAPWLVLLIRCPRSVSRRLRTQRRQGRRRLVRMQRQQRANGRRRQLLPPQRGGDERRLPVQGRLHLGGPRLRCVAEVLPSGLGTFLPYDMPV